MKLFLIMFFGASAMVIATNCNSSTSGEHVNEGKRVDSTAPVEGGSYNKDTTAYERNADTASKHH